MNTLSAPTVPAAALPAVALPVGYYTIAADTIQVCDGGAPGRQYIKRSMGGATLSTTWFNAGQAFGTRVDADVLRIYQALATDAAQEGARIQFAQVHHRCAVCGRRLSALRSTRRGIGPECAKAVA